MTIVNEHDQLARRIGELSLSNHEKITLAEIAKHCGLKLQGDGNIRIHRLCGLSDNQPDALSFVANAELTAAAEKSNIPAFVVRPDAAIKGKASLFHDNPDYAISQIADLFRRSQLTYSQDIHASAIIDDSVTLGDNVSIGPNVVIGANVNIGANTRIIANVVIMDHVTIGEDCLIYPQCVIREDCSLGDRVILQSGVKIGGDGYGFAHYNGEHVKTPQLGNVILEADVEVGANATIDRGRFTATRIGAGTKIDNLVMVAHNVQTGQNCLLVSQSGVSGSTVLGNNVTLAGQVGLVGHINIADNVTLLGQSMATKDIREAGMWAGSPARPAALWRKAVAGMYANLNKKR